jgi:hypothetical protein
MGNASSLCRHGYKRIQVPAKSSNESFNKKIQLTDATSECSHAAI